MQPIFFHQPMLLGVLVASFLTDSASLLYWGHVDLTAFDPDRLGGWETAS